MTEMEKAPAQDVAAAPRTQPDLFDRLFGEWPWPRSRFLAPLWTQLEGSDLLRVEESVTDKEVVVRAEMPGIDPDKDVEITVSDHTLRMRAERKEETTSDENGMRRSEFRYGSFSRSVPLPVGASDKDVKATYKDGILEVRIPLDQQQAEARRVKVKRS
ncbi:MAG TPA: Hsp20/alpha crystallin family protein [Acidimicrobiia bacterium]|nr:Hsp20/alpha crystallin family protein [Acidimicrobiia bacterium]